MNHSFFLHVNNHVNVRSHKTLCKELRGTISNLPKGVKIKIIPPKRKSSCTFAGNMEGNMFKIGAAICHPNDQFCKKVGPAKAEGRARSSNSIKILIPEDVLSSNKTGTFFAKTCRELLPDSL